MKTLIHRLSARVLAPAALLAALLSTSSTASAQGIFDSWNFAGGWPNSGVTARADWSSDLGPDWIFGSYPSGDVVGWSGPGTTWSSGPYQRWLAGNTVGWELDRRGGAVGETYSGGEITVSPTLSLENGAVARISFHLWSVLGDNSVGYGIDTGTTIQGYPWITAGSQLYAPLHWRLDWRSQTTGNANTSSSLYTWGVHRQIGNTEGSASGLFTAGSYAWQSGGSWLAPDLILSTYAGDASQDPRSGRIDTWLTLSFSRDVIPDPSVLPEPPGGGTTAVPEPSTYGLMAAAALMGLVIRRKMLRGRRAAE